MSVIINVLFQIIKIIFMLSFLVIIHEFSHFSMAKFFKIPVKEFAVGFGKKIWGKEKNGTVYSIRLFLLGGFVDIDDEAKEGNFAKAPLYQKNLILIAGVLSNFIFAIVIGFFVLFAQGQFVSNEITIINEEAPIYFTGVQTGDKITKINGKKIKTKNQIDTIMYSNNGESLDIEILRNGEIKKINASPYKIEYPSAGIGVDENNTISYVQKNSKPYISGIQVGDKIEKIDDEIIENNEELISIINNSMEKTVAITLNRNDEILDKKLEIGKYSKYYIGVSLKEIENTLFNKIYYSTIEISDYIYETMRGLILLITGQNQNAELMGIIGVSSIITKTESFLEYLSIMSSISLSLAIVNLFPLPLLDGGKILIYTIEKYRKKEFSEKFLNITNNVTMTILVILTLYIMFNDVMNLI